MAGPIVHADALARAREVFEKQDEAGFQAIADALGIAIPFDKLYAYVHKHAKSPWADFTGSVGEGTLQLIYTTLSSEHAHPHAMKVIYGHTTLVARSGDRLVLGIQDGADSQPFKKWGWKITPRWYKDPARNGKTIENWLADPKRELDSISIAIVRELERPASDDRGAALLAAVCADPQDLAARLVYGDWLVERGDARGELIRVQCDLERVTGEQRETLEAREEELLDAYEAAMIEPIKRFVDRARIHRGLVGEIEIFGDQLIKHGAAIVAAHPIVKLRAFVKDAEQFGKLAAMSWIGNIAHATYQGRSRKGVMNSGAKLRPSSAVGTAMFARTRTLSFEYVEDSGKEWSKFYAGITAPDLEALRVSELDDDAIIALGRSRGLPKLRDLALYSLAASGRTPKPLGKLAELALAEIEASYWGRTPKLGACIGALLAPTVRSLELEWLQGDGLARALSDRGGNLERLSLSRLQDLDVGEVAELLAKQRLPKLQQLSVIGLSGDEAACEAFTKAVCAAPKSLVFVNWTPSLNEGTNATEEQSRRIIASGRTYRWKPTASWP